MNKISEKLLLYRIQAKQDSEAFGQLYDTYVKQIYRFVYFKVSSREEAEDVTADVFLKTWNYLRENKEVKSFSGLLYRVARTSIIDLYRSRTNQPVLMTEELEMSDGGAWYKKLELKIENENLVQALKKLKQEYQEIIILRFVDELEMDEIGEIMNKGVVAVRVTLHRALKKLKEIAKQ
jgi:RNA polymerase sigma-70 factor (ECF subfamily)